MRERKYVHDLVIGLCSAVSPGHMFLSDLAGLPEDTFENNDDVRLLKAFAPFCQEKDKRKAPQRMDPDLAAAMAAATGSDQENPARP
jgi:hypothetical protein